MWYFLVFLSLSHTVSWVRCATLLYWFLIFALLCTPPHKHTTLKHVCVLLLFLRLLGYCRIHFIQIQYSWVLCSLFQPYGGGSVVVDSLFIVALIGFCVCSLFWFMPSPLLYSSVLCVLLVLKWSWWGRESCVFYFGCLPFALWLLVFWGSFSRSRGVVCNVWLWYFLVTLTYFFGWIPFKQACHCLFSKPVDRNGPSICSFL